MWTGNLSHYVFESKPPSNIFQQLNRWLHEEPIDTLVNGIYWCIIFMFGAPIIGMLLLGYTISYFIVWLVKEKLVKKNKNSSLNVLEAAEADSRSNKSSSTTTTSANRISCRYNRM